MNITKYRSKVRNMDRAQLLNEIDNILDQQEQVWAGTRDAIDYPADGVERRPEKKFSVGPSVEAKPEKRDIKYYGDGSIKSYRLDGGLVKVAPK